VELDVETFAVYIAVLWLLVKIIQKYKKQEPHELAFEVPNIVDTVVQYIKIQLACPR
jgi:hypothetical protein